MVGYVVILLHPKAYTSYQYIRSCICEKHQPVSRFLASLANHTFSNEYYILMKYLDRLRESFHTSFECLNPTFSTGFNHAKNISSCWGTAADFVRTSAAFGSIAAAYLCTAAATYGSTVAAAGSTSADVRSTAVAFGSIEAAV